VKYYALEKLHGQYELADLVRLSTAVTKVFLEGVIWDGFLEVEGSVWRGGLEENGGPWWRRWVGDEV
jgi:hypothetical protein